MPMATFLIDHHSDQLRSISSSPDPNLHFPLFIEYYYYAISFLLSLSLFFYCYSKLTLFFFLVTLSWWRIILALHVSSLPNPKPTCQYSMMLPFGPMSVILSLFYLFWFGRDKGGSLTLICVLGRVRKSYCEKCRMTRRGLRKNSFMFVLTSVAHPLNALVCFFALYLFVTLPP